LKDGKDRIVENMDVPESLIEAMGEFDPIQCCINVLNKHLFKIFMGANGTGLSDEDFIKLMTTNVQNMLTDLIGNLVEGFDTWE